jgi:3-carboxy-cis,cis-muconate cycloisomerase
VNVERMAQNVVASNGLMLAERLSLALTPALGREKAKQVLREACESAIRENRNVVDVARERVRMQVNGDLDWNNLRSERHYLGAAQVFIDRVLREVNW